MSQNCDPKLTSNSDLKPSSGGSGSHPAEDAYWSANYLTRDYVDRNRPYADYRPAYQYGWESRVRLGNKPFGDVESDLERGWDLAKGESMLAWAQAKHAASDAWHRIACAGPANATRARH